MRRARAAVERALALEPDLAETHAAMESIQTYHDWDWRGAERSIRRALELAPGNGAGPYGRGTRGGRPGGGGAESDAVLQEDIAKYGESDTLQIAEAYGARGDADRAFAWLEQAYVGRDGGLSGVMVSP